MANHAYHNLQVRKVYVSDDGGAFGVGIADSFQRRAKELGMAILGRDQLNPKEADYKTILTKIKGLSPDVFTMVASSRRPSSWRGRRTKCCRRSTSSAQTYDLAFPEQVSRRQRAGGLRTPPGYALRPQGDGVDQRHRAKYKREPIATTLLRHIMLCWLLPMRSSVW